MKNFFRKFAALALAGACAAPAAAQDGYPARPIRLLVAYASGGPTDVIARVLAQDMSATLGQTVYVENQGAASSMVAAREIRAAAPDGYSLLFAAVGHNVNPILQRERAGYDPQKDFAPIASVATTPLIVVTAYDAPVQTMGDLVKLIRSKPQGVTFGSSGTGGSGHLAGELLATTLHQKMLHVPFRGTSAALLDVMAGRVDFMFYPIVGVAEARQARKLKVLAAATAQRLPQFPDVPTMAEVGLPGFEETAPWIGMLAPAGTPPAIVGRLNAAVAAALAKPQVRTRIEGMGGIPMGSSPQEFAAYLQRDYSRWEKVIRAAGVTVD
ncbi:tripartite tricarboxylate transporter substrate binding protein [Pigmentiphaga soli]|uniref:Tripartite tricarboxylate transporter substrate binding protein n=1 Tax=Pigmentiphaga soli TaxID=1007095 RepID=A0ABP8GDV9_9BURK